MKIYSEIRKELGLTQVEMGKLLGKSRQGYHWAERHGASIKETDVRRLMQLALTRLNWSERKFFRKLHQVK